MQVSYSSEEIAFRDEVRTFLDENLPARIRDKVRHGLRLARDDYVTWHDVLNQRGWLCGSWPVEYGGPGWSAVQRHIFDEECWAAGAPRIVPFGVGMLAPVLMRYGSEAQQNFYLPRILDGSDWWCQGYSEPNSGSDLASLATRAERDGDHYIVNGQKTWTTLGHFANRIFCLVRTSREGKPQQGISFLLIDMDSPGVEVRPIVLLDGEHEVNEVFFTDVRVPVENRVGEENEGWTYAKYLLTHERTGLASVGAAASALAHVKFIASRQMQGGRSLLHDPYFAARLARAEIELESLKTSNLRVLAGAGGHGASVDSSMLKVKGTRVLQTLNDLARRALGPQAIPFVSEALDEGHNEPAPGPDYANPVASRYFNNRKQSIFGGSNEIQKNIIAKTLGL